MSWFNDFLGTWANGAHNTINYSDNNGSSVTPPSSLVDYWNNTAFGNEFNDIVNNTLFPGDVAAQDWARQMVSQMYQNHWNSAPEQMRRAMEAGINPYLAANGIAGNGSSSAQPAPNSAVGAGASGLNSIASTLGTLGNIASQGISGFAMLKKLRPEIDKITAETSNLFESMGFTKLQSKALSIQLKYMDEKESIGVWQALANFNRTKQEYSNLKATHRNILAQYDEIIAQKDLLIAEKGEVEARKILNQAMADKERAIAQWYNDENKFFENHHFRSGDPIYESLRNMMVEEGTFSPEAFGDVVSEYEGKVSYAVSSNHFKADEETAYNRAHNAGKGSLTADPFQQQYRQLYDEIDDLSNLDKDCDTILKGLKEAHDSGKITDEEYKQLQKNTLATQRQIRKDLKELNKHFSKMSYSVGHASQLQDIKQDLIKLGVVAGGYTFLKQSPAPIKGFSR